MNTYILVYLDTDGRIKYEQYNDRGTAVVRVEFYERCKLPVTMLGLAMNVDVTKITEGLT